MRKRPFFLSSMNAADIFRDGIYIRAETIHRYTGESWIQGSRYVSRYGFWLDGTVRYDHIYISAYICLFYTNTMFFLWSLTASFFKNFMLKFYPFDLFS